MTDLQSSDRLLSGVSLRAAALPFPSITLSDAAGVLSREHRSICFVDRAALLLAQILFLWPGESPITLFFIILFAEMLRLIFSVLNTKILDGKEALFLVHSGHRNEMLY